MEIYDFSTTDLPIVDQINHHSTNIINISNETCVTNDNTDIRIEKIFVTSNVHKTYKSCE